MGLAVLGLFAEVARARPLVCVLDDAQWLDRASAQVLAFVARRLLAESVAMIFAVRESPTAEQPEVPELAGLAELPISGLPDDDARLLLTSTYRGPVDAPVLDRVLAEAGGNPLALLELPRGFAPSELAGGFGLLERQQATGLDRAEFPTAGRATPSRDTAAAARGRRGTGRRPGARPAGGRTTRHPRRDSCTAGGGGGPGRVRDAGAVPSSALALGDLPRRPTRRTPSRARGARARSPTRRPIRIGARGTTPKLPPGPTRTSPPNWNAPLIGHVRGADWPRRPHSSSVRQS